MSKIIYEQRTIKRDDIQVLRGIAVSLVVLYHSGIVPIPAGYLGVDIFFVISGFLITSHIIRDIDRKNFSLREFYLWRARRLLPATYCTLSFATLAAYFFLLPTAWPSFIKQLVGALTFTANIFLWRQTGYFEAASITKPLLHLWSLSVEEQFYLLLPVFLLVVGTRSRHLLIVSTMLASASLWMYFATVEPSAAFFLLPTRAWQLLLGSLLANAVLKRPDLRIPLWIKVASIAVITVIPFFPIDVHLHRLDSPLVTVATAFLLVSHDEWPRPNLMTRALSSVGDWSYSIYLVHWPLFSFAAIGYLEKIPTSVAATLIPVSFTLGYLQYRYIEQPMRFGWQTNGRVYLKYLAVASLIIALPIPIYLYQTSRPVEGIDLTYLLRPNYGLDEACEYWGADFDDRPQCRLSVNPKVALWGDSFAMQWGAGLAAELHGVDLIQMTESMCGPIRGLAIVDDGHHSKNWAEMCIRFNESVFNYISDNPSIKTVVLSSAFSQYTNRNGQSFLVGDRLEAVSVEVANEKFLDTILALRQLGKRVIVIAPAPSLGFNIGACIERRANGLFVFGSGRNDCNFSYLEYATTSKNVIGFLKLIYEKSNIEIIWPEKVICGEELCKTQIGETKLYFDGSHLSYGGSVLVAKALNLGKRLGLN
jgi:peptidoglycan/LPS O-acetylase OafA/YrhL